MTHPRFPHALTTQRPVQIGLVVLQTDESIEYDFRCLIPPEIELFVTRVPSGDEVTPETLAAMEGHLAGAAALLPPSARFAAMGYACTSGSAQIGPARVAELLHGAAETRWVTNPLNALVAACGALGLRRLALLSPYGAEVSERLRSVLAAHGIDTPVFGSFEVPEEARVARIDGASIIAAAEVLAEAGGCDGLFLSCTNLRTLELIPELEARLGLPVLSSNQVLGWDLLRLAGVAASGPGRLFGTETLATQEAQG